MNFMLYKTCHSTKVAVFQATTHVLFLLLLLLLTHFTRVQLCVTPQTSAHQAPPFLGFSRQDHWSGLTFPSPMCESEVAQSCPTLSDPMGCSLPGSSIRGIFQARVLEWGTIAFSKPCACYSKNSECYSTKCKRIFPRGLPTPPLFRNSQDI